MNFDTPKKENLKPGSQLDIFDLQDILEKIRKEYPHAQLNEGLIEGDQVHGYTFKGRPLMEAAKDMNELFSTSDTDDMYKH